VNQWHYSRYRRAEQTRRKKRTQGLRCYQETEQWKEAHSSSEKEKE